MSDSWPDTTARDAYGEMLIGGVPLPFLAREFGTPLYVFDEATLRSRARAIRETFADAYPDSRVVYAGKAYLSPALMGILVEEGIGLDVVSGGELYAGLISGVSPSAIVYHGNNKSASELEDAVTANVGVIAVDNFHEIELLAQVTRRLGKRANIALRLNPGVDPHTHSKMRTGATDSKFGFPVWDGQADRAVGLAAGNPLMTLVGYHAHVGSQIFDPDLVAETISAIMAFAARVHERHGVAPRIVIPGGGFGVADDASGQDVSIVDWARAAADALRRSCSEWQLPLPELVVEPGRAIIGPAGVAVYEVGSRKEIAGTRTYVSVDGGMSDNIRPSLYGARYSAALANRAGDEEPREDVTIAGKYCESGDVLIDRISLPVLEPGDLLAVPMAGAYCLAMASNYNLAPRPAAVLVHAGNVQLIRRRESYADLLQWEVFERGRVEREGAGRLSAAMSSL
jgi:diaminopimelate decarboxylase